MSEDRIDLQFDSFRGFLEECSNRISEEGIFLATEKIRPVGSRVEFHLGIDAGFPLLRGTGEVLWVVEPNGGGETPGMAVRYESTDEATATLARKIAERQRERSESVFDLNRSGGAAAAAESAVVEPPAAEPAPSLATQAVDALIEGPAELETEALEVEPSLEPPVEPEPEPEPEAPVEAAEAPEELGEPTVEMEPPAKRRAGLWAALALVAALAGAAYWQRDLLSGLLGGTADDRPAAPAAEPEPAEPAEPEIQEPVEPEVQAVAEPAAEEPAEPDDVGAPPPAPLEPLTRVEEVRWEASVGVTVLELVADGAFAADGYTLERLEDPPRVLLKIAGVAAPLPSPTVAVGSEEVVGVRTGLHGSPPETSLHVVVDLADPTAQVTAAEALGAVLQLRVASSAISP